MKGARIVGGGCAIVVSTIAAWSSYWHMVHVALRYGERDEIAYVLPLSVDGLLTVSALAMTEDRQHHRPIRAWAKIGFVLGLGASLAANVSGADPTIGGRLIAAWSPLALFVVGEILTHAPSKATIEHHSTGSGERSGGTGGEALDGPLPVPQNATTPDPAPEVSTATSQDGPEPQRNDEGNIRGNTGQEPAARRPADLTRQRAADLSAADPDLTQKQIAAQLGITTRRLRTVLTPQPAPPPQRKPRGRARQGRLEGR